MTTKRELARGALWRQWDLHIHTPASFHWLGQRFSTNPIAEINKNLVEMSKKDLELTRIGKKWRP